MQIKSETLKTITQMIHVVGAPPAVTTGVCGTSLVLVAQQPAGPTIYISVEQGIEQDCQSLAIASRMLRVIANHAQGILDFERGFVRSQANNWEWQLPANGPAGPPVVPPEIGSAFQIADCKTFYRALAAVVNSGSGDAVVQTVGKRWSVACPELWAWADIPADPAPLANSASFVIRKYWASAIIAMLQAVGSGDGQLLFSVTDGKVVIGWYATDRSAMVSLVIPHEQATIAVMPVDMTWLGTVEAAAFHRAISAIEAATAPDEAATLSMTDGLNMSTEMLQLQIPVLEGNGWWPIGVWINTAPTRWLTGEETVELWRSSERLYVIGKSLVASWRTV